uniref:U-box domain-containing protein n=1 Tax=Lotharella oceanica TaxID=641309 RepID=A0A7S2TQE8_9EUKA
MPEQESRLPTGSPPRSPSRSSGTAGSGTASPFYKIYECQYWKDGRCLRGENWSYVHAHICPGKKGICHPYLDGNCCFTDKNCYYQHLPIPLRKYEMLARKTANFQELLRRVEFQAKKFQNNKEKSDPTTMEGLTQAVKSSHITTEENTPTCTVILPAEKKAGAKYSFVPESKGFLDLPAEFLCPIGQTIMNDPVVTEAGKTYDRSMIEIWLTQNDIDPLTRRRISAKLVPNQAMKKMIRAYKNERRGPTWKSKALEEWGPEDVGDYIRARGKAACWGEYAKTLVNEEVDGSTLLSYQDLDALLEDFPLIKRPHARNLSLGIRNLILHR